MRIGLVTPEWPGDRAANGIVTCVRNLATGIEALNHQVAIIPIKPCEKHDERVINLPPVRQWTLYERVAAKLGGNIVAEIAAERIAAAVDRQGIDVLVMEETFGWAGLVQKRLSIPVVVILHGPWFILKHLAQADSLSSLFRNREYLEGNALAVCKAIAAPSRYVLELSMAHYGITGALSMTLPNSIFPKEKMDYATLGQRARNSILFVGHYSLLKGGDVVLDAFSELIRRGHDVFLTFVGHDNGIVDSAGNKRFITETLEALPEGTRTRVRYMGVLSQAEIDQLRQEHAIAVVASRAEIFCYAVLESLASGVATIATEVGGIPEILRQGQNGMLVQPGDPIALADAVQRLFENPALCEQLGSEGYADVIERFSPVRIAGDLISFLKGIR